MHTPTKPAQSRLANAFDALVASEIQEKKEAKRLRKQAERAERRAAHADAQTGATR